MARLIKWLVGLAIIAGVCYFGLVAVTGSQMRSIAEEQLETYNAQSPDAEVTITWHETGFWRSVGDVELSIPLEGETLHLIHSIELNHGALRAGISGEVTGEVGDTALNTMLFAGESVRLDGRISLAGVRLTYAFPELRYFDDALEMNYSVAPFDLDLVLKEHEQHSQFEIEWIEMMATVIGATDTMRWENIEVTSQSRLNEDDRQFDHAQTVFSIDEMTFGATDDAMARIRGTRNETEMTRVDGNVNVDNRLTVDSYDVYGVEGELNMAIQMGPMPFASFQALQRDAENSAAVAAFLSDLQTHDSKLVIESFELTMGQMGNLIADGEFWLRKDVDFNQQFSAQAAGDIVAGELEIEDLPVLILMPLSGMISGDLPWTVELSEGDLLINGERLDLPDM